MDAKERPLQKNSGVHLSRMTSPFCNKTLAHFSWLKSGFTLSRHSPTLIIDSLFYCNSILKNLNCLKLNFQKIYKIVEINKFKKRESSMHFFPENKYI